MRAMAVDGRIGPGSIPAILQGRRNWSGPGQWVEESVPNAPDQPAWRVLGQGAVRDAPSAYVKVKPGQVISWSVWLRATTRGTSSAYLPFLAATASLENSQIAWLAFLSLVPASMPTAWTYYRGLWVVPASYVSMSLRLTVRNKVADGAYQACGARLSIIGAMPAP